MKTIFSLSILIMLALFFNYCKKDNSLPPSAITISAIDLSNTSARLKGTINANNGSTTVSFDYGLNTSYGVTIKVQTPIAGSTPETITSDITGLTSGIIYHYRIKAVNEKGTTYGEDMQFTTTIDDVDGNSYNAVTIGIQTWMLENLKTIKYSDGTAIPNVPNSTEWQNLTTPAYSWYDNDPTTYKDVYGALYNWYAVNTGKLCPDGWHVPSDAEWTTLTDYFGGIDLAGGKLKQNGTYHWSSPNIDASNESGFTALPGGVRYDDGIFKYIKFDGYWWSSTANGPEYAWSRIMSYYGGNVFYGYTNDKKGLSVRCIRN